MTGSKPKTSGESPPGPYFQTHFQSESQFIVEAIVSDLAEQIFYAKYHRLPDKKYFSVTALEKGGTIDAPVYELQIRLEPKNRELKLDLNISGPIWSPTVYQRIAGQLAEAVGLSAG